MWGRKERDSSNKTPRFFTVGSQSKAEVPRVIEPDKFLHLATELGVPMRITSVLEWLSFRKLSESQLEIEKLIV